MNGFFRPRLEGSEGSEWVRPCAVNDVDDGIMSWYPVRT